MDPDVAAFGQVMVIVLSSLAAVVAITLGARVLWRIGSRTPKQPLPPAGNREELQRLQNAVDAIAIEVERISEAQRFTVKLLGNGVTAGKPADQGEASRRGITHGGDTPR